MSNFVALLIFIWAAVSMALTKDVIDDRFERCGVKVSAGYTIQVAKLSVYWPMLLVVDGDKIADVEKTCPAEPTVQELMEPL